MSAKLSNIFRKERLTIILAFILLFVCGIFSVWMAYPSISPVLTFKGLFELALAVVLFAGGLFMLFSEYSQIGAFIGLGFGLLTILGTISSMSFGLDIIFKGVIPLIAGILGYKAQKETTKKIWQKRIKGFWFEFSHNKIGLIGLAILLIFVVIAIFEGPIAALSYPDPEAKSLAEKYAKPLWIGLIDPSSRNLPPTVNYTLDWTGEPQPYENVTIERIEDKWVIRYNRTDQKKVVVCLNATLYYPYDPPNRFTFIFSWGAKVSSVRYSLEINVTTPDGDVWPVWDQHWWKYKAANCYERNPYSYLGQPLYYPGGPQYDEYHQHKEYPWSEPLYDRPAYGIYDAYYGGEIPQWTANFNETVTYSLSRYPPIRLGFREFQTYEMTSAMFSPSGNFTYQLYVTIVPTSKTGTCEITISQFQINIPGLIWGLLGTNWTGQDCWARLIYGAKTSILVGLSAAILATSIGVLVGIAAGYIGGIVDEALMRIVDILLCLPVLPLLMVLVTFFGRSIVYIILIIAVFGWQGLSRLIRSQVLSLREAPFIECAKASGGSSAYIMGKHLLPNVMPVALADFILSVPGAIILEAALSYLGFGDPSTPTWGREYSIMQDVAEVYIVRQGVVWWWFIPPGLAITLLCMAFVFIGHAVDEIVNPRLRRRR